MTKEEMQARGYVPEEVKRQQHRRAQWHDYNQKGIFMITLVTAGRRPLFGHLEGTSKAPRGSYDAPRLVLSPLGKSILEEEIPKITKHYPMVKVWRVAMMPDHLHLLLRVEEPLPKGKHLGFVLGGFKTGCSRAWWRLMDQERGLPACRSTTAPAAPALLGWAVGDTDGGGAFPTEGTRAPRPRASCCGREGAAGSRRSHAREGWLSRWSPGVQSVGALPALYLPAGSRQTSFLLGSQDGGPGCSQADTQRPGGQGSRSPPWDWLRTRRPVTRREMKPIRVCLGAGPPLLAPR